MLTIRWSTSFPVLILLVCLLCACQSATPATPDLSATTATPTATATLAPTATATPTDTPSPTLSPTPTATPLPVWQILFRGHPCGENDCWPTDDGPTYTYAINSDGSDLHEVDEFPPDIVLPGNPDMYSFMTPQLSLDGAMWAYLDGYRTLTLINSTSGQAYDGLGGGQGTVVGAVCWALDGKSLIYSVQYLSSKYGDKDSEFYQKGCCRFHSVENRSQMLFTVPSELWIENADCSPHGHEMVFANSSANPDKSKLYVINLHTGEWRVILSGYFFSTLRTAPAP